MANAGLLLVGTVAVRLQLERLVNAIMPKGLATAAVDRLLHHAHVVLTEGTSTRLTEALAGKGVKPLA